MPFSTFYPPVMRRLSTVRAALLGLAVCLLLSAAPFAAAAQTTAQAADTETTDTQYQAITRQAQGHANHRQILQGLGLLLTLSLGVLFVRFVRNEALAARQAELEGWATPHRFAAASDESLELVASSSGLYDSDRFEIRADNDDDDEQYASASESYDEPAQVLPRPSAPAPLGAPATRIIYHVGPYRFSADREVLGTIAHGHLDDLCDALCSPDNTRRVVRIASGLSSRYAKSQVAAELAQMLADRDMRVLAMEGDLDAPALHRALRVNVPRGYGLSEQLQRMAELEALDTASVMQLSPCLHVLVESRWSTPAALGLPQFSQLLTRQRDVYDFVIIDGPVVDTWPDAEHFGRLIDGVVFVTLASTRLPDTLTLVGQHFSHDLLLRIVKTGEPSGA